jgi:hypothetical protein
MKKKEREREALQPLMSHRHLINHHQHQHHTISAPHLDSPAICKWHKASGAHSPMIFHAIATITAHRNNGNHIHCP